MVRLLCHVARRDRQDNQAGCLKARERPFHGGGVLFHGIPPHHFFSECGVPFVPQLCFFFGGEPFQHAPKIGSQAKSFDVDGYVL